MAPIRFFSYPIFLKKSKQNSGLESEKSRKGAFTQCLCDCKKSSVGTYFFIGKGRLYNKCMKKTDTDTNQEPPYSTHFQVPTLKL